MTFNSTVAFERPRPGRQEMHQPANNVYSQPNTFNMTRWPPQNRHSVWGWGWGSIWGEKFSFLCQLRSVWRSDCLPFTQFWSVRHAVSGVTIPVTIIGDGSLLSAQEGGTDAHCTPIKPDCAGRTGGRHWRVTAAISGFRFCEGEAGGWGRGFKNNNNSNKMQITQKLRNKFRCLRQWQKPNLHCLRGESV